MISQWLIPALVVGMLVAGCTNSLLTKFQDNQCVKDCDTDSPKFFEQPVFQSVQMFVAEMLCWIMHWIVTKIAKGQDVDIASASVGGGYAAIGTPDDAEGPPPELEGKKVSFLSIPAALDMTATTLMNLGLLFVPVSVYQMMRGAVVLFVGVLSTIFLRHKITKVQWLGLLAVVGGVFLVGLSAAFERHPHTEDANVSVKVVAGIGMILFGQLFTATQFVYEERLLELYTLEPLRLVAWEGTFGAFFTIVGSIILYFIIPSHPRAFNLTTGLSEVTSSSPLIISSVGIMISMATFNFCGISVTRKISATSRSTVDTCRTLGIWLVSLLLGWEKFRFMQLVGFGLLVYGTLLFNGLIGASAKDPLPNEFEHS